VFVTRLQTMAETPPDHAHLKKKKLHASLCFYEEKDLPQRQRCRKFL